MFQGVVGLTIDAKGRLAVPTRHREALAEGGSVVMTAHPHRCVLVYPPSAWAPIRDRVVAAPSLDSDSASLKRMLVGYADEQQLDGAGRVLVSPALRQFAELDKQVWLVGLGHHFELWSDARWQAQQAKMFSLDDKTLPAGFADLAL